MITTWRARDSRGHYLTPGDVHTSLEPDAWDDTCRHTPTELEPSSETFGHQPVTWGGKTTCARCRTAPPYTDDDIDGAPDDAPLPDRSVLWPCTSAVVLGLVPRPAAPVS